MKTVAMKTAAWPSLNIMPQGLVPACPVLPSAVQIQCGSAASRSDSMNAKYFSDALMMDRVGIAIPPVARKAEFV